MAQVKIYGLNNNIQKNRTFISDAIHLSLQHAFELPKEKRFQRFITLSKEDFIFPHDRTDQYIIIEISVFEGRSVEAKKELVKGIFNNLQKAGFECNDVEITIFETQKANWGIRGISGDELQLNYKVEV